MTVLHYLEKTARDFSGKTAIADEYGSFTFSQLRDYALSIAGHIAQSLDGQTRKPILVYLPKGKECIAAFMGIVYSSNIYTPTDVWFPFPKVQGIIDVLEPALYISSRKYAQKLCDNGISSENILIYEDISESVMRLDANRAIHAVIDTDPVYVFFTSGSTGKPKGVIISHKNILDFTDWFSAKFDIDESHVIGNQAPFYFDQSTPDVYLCIKTGATMHIIPENLFAYPIRLMEYINEHRINFINWVPSAICHVANSMALDSIMLPYLKKVFFCGEVMPNKQLNYWRSHISGASYVNLYGPTEVTHSCTYYIVDREFSDDEPLPIGFPDENTDILLLDSDNNLVTDNDTQGEICVRGSSLSHGYWNNPEKTAEVFCQNPLNPQYSERIYRTGDLAYYNEKGEIMFDGRKDFQIKHLGYRIELGEIETMASSLDGIDTVCADYDNIEQEIVIFYSGKLEEKDLRTSLLRLLPKYMVPTRYIELEEFPYNDNGKIDRIKLRAALTEV